MKQPLDVPTSTNIESALNRAGYLIMSGPCCFEQPKWHRHAGLEISLVHAGVANVFSSEWEVPVLPGRAVFSACHTAHGSQGEFNRTVLHFLPELVPAQFRDLIDRLLGPVGRFEFAPSPDAAYRFIWATQQLDRLLAMRGSWHTAQALLGLVFSDLQTASAHAQSREAPPEELVQLVAFMHANPESDLTVDALIRRFGLGRSAAFAQFFEYAGSSPGAYWERIRLDHACRLLRSGERVQDVARRIGFASLRGFQRAFRRRYDMTPSQYQALYGRATRNRNLA